jgi:hypothetical protein
MKKKSKKIINENIDQILKDIKTKVLNEHGLDDVNISEITFSTQHECPVGSHWACQYLGKDPITNKPIMRCGCVPNNP